MRIALPMSAALLLLAFAPSASALCVGDRVCAEATVQHAQDTVGDVVDWIEGQELDGDADGIPDLLESEACGRNLTREVVQMESVPGECHSTSDLDLGSAVDEAVAWLGETVAWAEEAIGCLVNQPTGLPNPCVGLGVDSDGDGLPDGLEPILCAFENSNIAQDGSCVGDDYTAPL